MKRKTKLIIIIGAPGTGKTTTTEKFLKAEKNRTLVVTPDDKDWLHIPNIYKLELNDWTFTGARRRIWANNNDLDLISDNFENGLIIFDDCRSYFKANLDETLHKFLIRRRQNQRDIIVAAHGFSEVPPKFFTFCTEIVLFNTQDNINARRDVLRNFDFVKKIQENVNKNALINPHYSDVIRY